MTRHVYIPNNHQEKKIKRSLVQPHNAIKLGKCVVFKSRFIPSEVGLNAADFQVEISLRWDYSVFFVPDTLPCTKVQEQLSNMHSFTIYQVRMPISQKKISIGETKNNFTRRKE